MAVGPVGSGVGRRVASIRSHVCVPEVMNPSFEAKDTYFLIAKKWKLLHCFVVCKGYNLTVLQVKRESLILERKVKKKKKKFSIFLLLF